MAKHGGARGRNRRLAFGATLGACAVMGAVVPSAAADGQPFIVGGHDATEEYAFMASLQTADGQHSCGASLIEQDWVVTAAHCVQGDTGPMQVRVGSADRTTGGTVTGVSEKIVHPEFDITDFGHGYDIALLKLDQSVPQQPIRVADDAGPAGTPTRILGWGVTCDEGQQCPELPVQLQELDPELVEAQRCDPINADRELCIDTPTEDAQACNGDSGGPQLKGTPGDWELIGATSRDGDEDPACGTGTGIYTDVTAYHDWIQQHIGA